MAHRDVRHQFQRLENHARGAVPVRRFQRIADVAALVRSGTFHGRRWAIARVRARRAHRNLGVVLPRSWLCIALPWALLTVGCGSSAERDGLGSLFVNTSSGSYLLRSRTELESRVLGPIALNLDSALPVVQSSEESLLAGSLALGGTEGPLR